MAQKRSQKLSWNIKNFSLVSCKQAHLSAPITMADKALSSWVIRISADTYDGNFSQQYIKLLQILL